MWTAGTPSVGVLNERLALTYFAGLLGLLSLYLCVREIISALDARYFPVVAATLWIVVTLVAAGACFTFATGRFRAHQ